MRMRSVGWVASLALPTALLLAAEPAGAVSTRSFRLDSAKELSAGELEGTAAHSDGRVTLGVSVRRLALDDVPTAWTFARADDGTVYIGTGNEGKIYRLEGDELSVFAETGQLVVSALAFDDQNRLYAGTLPKGHIFRIGDDGEAEKLARPGEAEHIWDLVWDADRGALFAATGPKGKVYSVDPGGNVEEFYDVEPGHVMSLALDADGTLYAGTSGKAVLLAINGPGRATVMHDLPGNEVTAVTVRDGTLAVGANKFPDPPRVSQSKKGKSRAQRPDPGHGRLFRIGPDGRAEKLFERKKGHFTAVQIGEDGTIYAASGKDGHIYRVGPDRKHALWVDVDERQVLDLDLLSDEPLFVTGDAGAVYRVLADEPQEAEWRSKVLDAKFGARWGELRWEADGTVELQTRSGNAKEPDDTWSDWSAPMTERGPIRSPKGRFLQIRARFREDPDATLYAIRAYYLPQNQRPVVESVALEDDDSDEEPPDPTTKYELSWEVDNPDDDELRYRLRFRREGQDLWRDILREHEKLTDDEHEWQTDGIPDGWYVVEVEASDAPDNPRPLALRSTEHSEPILIDNHDPRIRELEARGGAIRGRAVDSLGPIAKLELKVDNEEWQDFFPVDHLLDTDNESFEIELDRLDLEPGQHIVAIRATDAGGNAVTRELTVTIGGG